MGDKLSMSENINVQENREPIVIMRDLTTEEYEKYLDEMREKALHDEASALNAAEKKAEFHESWK